MGDDVEYPELVDVLRYETREGPAYRSVPAGEGRPIVVAHEDELRKRVWLRRVGIAGVAVAAVVVGALIGREPIGAVVAAILVGSVWIADDDRDGFVPELVDERVRRERATATYDIDGHAADPWTGRE